MWMTGSLVLIITAALVGMTTNPSDYTVAIVDSACAPLEKSSKTILAVLNAVLDFLASPVLLLSKIGKCLVDFCRDFSITLINSFMRLLEFGVRGLACVVQRFLSFIINFAAKVVTYFGIFDGVVESILPLIHIIRNWCMTAQRTLDRVFLDVILHTYTRACLLYIIDFGHFMFSFPFVVVKKVTDVFLSALQYIIALPFTCLIELVKYVLYSLLHPYVCVVYSSCTVGIFVILVPVLMHACRVKDFRPLIRWICAVALNTESRNRVLQILYRMAREDGREMITLPEGSENDTGRVEDETETRGECAVCYGAERLVKIFPCGHKTTCGKCLQEIEKINNRCPICREQILFII